MAKDKVTLYDTSNMVLEEFLEAWMQLFHDSLETFRDPEKPLAEDQIRGFEEDYKAAVEAATQLQIEKKGDWTILDLHKKLPRNIWMIWQQMVFDDLNREHKAGSLLLAPSLPRDKKSYRKKAIDRKKGRDVM